MWCSLVFESVNCFGDQFLVFCGMGFRFAAGGVFSSITGIVRGVVKFGTGVRFGSTVVLVPITTTTA